MRLEATLEKPVPGTLKERGWGWWLRAVAGTVGVVGVVMNVLHGTVRWS